MSAEFRWNEWNLEHVTLHGVTIEEAEMVVVQATPPYPEYIGDGKHRVYGRGTGGRLIHVIFILDDDGTVYIIHARPVITASEKRRVRRRKR